MLEKLLADSAGYLLVLVGLVTVVTVGVMSILLPFMVFKIMNEVAGLNRKMDRIITLLGEQRQERRRKHGPTAGWDRPRPGGPQRMRSATSRFVSSEHDRGRRPAEPAGRRPVRPSAEPVGGAHSEKRLMIRLYVSFNSSPTILALAM